MKGQFIVVLKRVAFKATTSRHTVDAVKRGTEIAASLSKYNSGTIKASIASTKAAAVHQIAIQLQELIRNAGEQGLQYKDFTFEVGSSQIEENGQFWLPNYVEGTDYNVFSA